MEKIIPDQIYAIVVGIGTYSKLGETWDLPNSAKDAIRFTEWLKDQRIPATNIWLLLSSHDIDYYQKNINYIAHNQIMDATYDKIGNVIKEQITQKSGDLLYIYWSGHGFMKIEGEIRLNPLSDATQRDFKCMQLNDTKGLLIYLRTKAFHFKHQILFFDCCAQHLNITNLSIVQFFLKESKNTPQYAVFSSPSYNNSYESHEEGSGLFSSILMKELKKYTDNHHLHIKSVVQNITESILKLYEDSKTKQSGPSVSVRNWNGEDYSTLNMQEPTQYLSQQALAQPLFQNIQEYAAFDSTYLGSIISKSKYLDTNILEYAFNKTMDSPLNVSSFPISFIDRELYPLQIVVNKIIKTYYEANSTKKDRIFCNLIKFALYLENTEQARDIREELTKWIDTVARHRSIDQEYISQWREISRICDCHMKHSKTSLLLIIRSVRENDEFTVQPFLSYEMPEKPQPEYVLLNSIEMKHVFTINMLSNSITSILNEAFGICKANDIRREDYINMPIEFFLSQEMLRNNSVHVEDIRNGKDGILLGIRHPLFVRLEDRSVEEYNTTYLKERWSRLLAPDATLHLLTSKDIQHWLDVKNAKEGFDSFCASVEGKIAVGVTFPPLHNSISRDSARPFEWIPSLLNHACIPVALWPRRLPEGLEDCEEMKKLIQDCLSGHVLSELPQTICQARKDATADPTNKQHPGHYLRLLWDDPTRLPKQLLLESKKRTTE